MTIQQTLERDIIQYQKMYYAGEPEISDGDYDIMVEKLREIDPKSSVLKKIGLEVVSGEKIKHLCPMGSQDKASNEAEFEAWFNKQDGTQLIIQDKLDGCSIELQYVNGQLRKAVTRGDGLEGEDITHNARVMRGVREQADNFTGSIRGEVIMFTQAFEKYGAGKANARNAAAGIMKRKDGKDSQYLTIICYDVTGDFATETEKIAFLVDLGFYVVPSAPVKDLPGVLRLRKETANLRTAMNYQIDGLVIKHDIIDRDDEALPRPTRQIAFKFDAEEATATITEVPWEQSGATFTPVGHFTPVQLCGTQVKQANLCNPANIAKLGLKIGSTVIITKRGEIIPKIERVLFTPPGAKDIPMPKNCPVCQAILVDKGTALLCPNSACDAKIEHQIAKWLDTLGIKGIGPATINDFVTSGVARSIPDLYKISGASLRGSDQSVSQQNIYDAIHSKKEISLAQYIAGFDIDGVGKSTIGTIVAAGFKSLERIMSATVEELSAINGIGEITAIAILTGIDANLADMLALTASGAITVLPEVEEGALLGCTVCFTGPLNTMSRPEAESLVRGAGGTAKSSIVRGLTYLVTNDTTSGSAKNVKAQALGVRIINEEQFLKICKGA